MSLTFDQLHEINVKRCEDVFHPLASWSLTDWSNAMAGEAGEACNVTKKIKRGDDAYADGVDIAGEPVISTTGRDRLAAELADVVCYADLLASRANIDLGEAVRAKFNKVSEKKGSDFRL